MSQPQKPMSKAEEAGTLLSILSNLGPALTLPEIGQIKSRLFRLVDLDLIPGQTFAEMQAERSMEMFNSEDDLDFGASEEAPKLEVAKSFSQSDDDKEPA